MKKLVLMPVLVLTLTACSGAVEETKVSVSEESEVISEVAEPVVEAVEATAENAQLASYEDFTDERYVELLGKKPFALFFYASWCPDCVYLEGQIKQNISDLPQEAVILKADFDTESQLKRDYGITVQSTIVVVDKDGNAMPTLFGPSFEDLKIAIIQSL